MPTISSFHSTRAATIALLGCSALANACAPSSNARAVVVVDGTSTAIATASLRSINGDYGPDCAYRAGPWSVAIANGATLDHPQISVVLNDAACNLTLTSLVADQTFSATPALAMGVAFQTTASGFSSGGPVAFYANARLPSAAFDGDFVIALLLSDNPGSGNGSIQARMQPTVAATSPADAAAGVSIARRLTVTFSAAMDPGTITPLSFTLSQGAVAVPGTVTLDSASRIATFTPNAALELGSTYTATMGIGARDAQHTPLKTDYVWSFTTAWCSQGRVNLGTASNFAVLAASTITNAGPTWISGDMGVSAGSAITGFPPGTVSGATYSGGAVAMQGNADLGAAYDDASGRTACPNVVTGDIGGQTLTPGLYASTSSLAIAAGDLTLDAQGERDAVFVFRMGSTLTTGAGRRVLLVNGARASNVFWQVGSSATLGESTEFHGTIMAYQTITLGPNVTLDGRALALLAAVNLDTDSVVTPAP